MEQLVAISLNTFKETLENWGTAAGRVDKVADLAYVWSPDEPLADFEQKPVHVALQAITHGNEVGGLQVLQTCLEYLKSGILKPKVRIAFVLGNSRASLANKRFIERDLNRAFGRVGAQDWEDQRARELEPLLNDVYYFLDIHQTIEPSSKPFFIFPYTRPCFAFAHALNQEIPIITHWGSSFSKDGMCTDEYVNHQGGVGITLELGQKGFDPYQTGVGIQCIMAAIAYAQRHALFGAPDQGVEHREVYTWKRVVSFETGMMLQEGLINFQPMKAGQVVGTSQKGELKAPVDGMLLFPKYLRDPFASPPKEIFRIMKRIGIEELGREGVIGS